MAASYLCQVGKSKRASRSGTDTKVISRKKQLFLPKRGTTPVFPTRLMLARPDRAGIPTSDPDRGDLRPDPRRSTAGSVAPGGRIRRTLGKLRTTAVNQRREMVIDGTAVIKKVGL